MTIPPVASGNHDRQRQQQWLPMMYSQCGADVFQSAHRSSDFLNEQGDTPTSGYNCHYQKANNTSTSCFTYPPNTWVTFYYKVSIGTWVRRTARFRHGFRSEVDHT